MRGARYLGRRDPENFHSLIQVKTNAVTLLKKEIARLEKSIITVGDWQQPVEKHYQLSRQMLEEFLNLTCRFHGVMADDGWLRTATNALAA